MKEERVEHLFEPFFDQESKVLILGSMPSPKSREQGFYYGHSRNRFWQVLADLFQQPTPETIPEKKILLKEHKLALWDVLASCRIRGADDNSIAEPIANDMDRILLHADIRAVFTTGGKATQLYQKLCYPVCGVASIRLPSTSPANCGCSYQRLREAYEQILEYL